MHTLKSLTLKWEFESSGIYAEPVRVELWDGRVFALAITADDFINKGLTPGAVCGMIRLMDDRGAT